MLQQSIVKTVYGINSTNIYINGISLLYHAMILIINHDKVLKLNTSENTSHILNNIHC